MANSRSNSSSTHLVHSTLNTNTNSPQELIRINAALEEKILKNTTQQGSAPFVTIAQQDIFLTERQAALLKQRAELQEQIAAMQTTIEMRDHYRAK